VTHTFCPSRDRWGPGQARTRSLMVAARPGVECLIPSRDREEAVRNRALMDKVLEEWNSREDRDRDPKPNLPTSTHSVQDRNCERDPVENQNESVRHSASMCVEVNS